MKGKILILLLIAAPLFIHGETDKQMAALYTDEAFYYYNRENYALADEYLEKAMEFSDRLPEAWYLGGLLREEQGDRIKSIELYKKSIDLTDVYTEYYYDLYFRYLNLLNITAGYRDVLDFFDENRAIFEKDLEILLKAADAAYRYGLIDYSRSLAWDVYTRNPYNLKSLLYLIRADRAGDYRERIRLGLHRLEKDGNDEVALQHLILEGEEPEKSEFISLYKEIFGETEFYVLLNDRNSETINKSRNLMIRSYGREELDDGVYFGDYNFDGVSDEIVSVSGNEMTYLRDRNQDNVTDLSINFTDGIPVNIYLKKGEIGFEFNYSSYPYLQEVNYFRDNSKRSYKVYPGTEYTPLNALDNFSWKYNENRTILSGELGLTETDLKDMSYLMAEYFPDETLVFREYSFRDGEVTGIREDSLGTGEFEYFLDISAWLPVAGRRDLNGDGIIDVFEYYEDGKISGIAIDWNNNGKPEYIEDWSVLNIKSWDFDEDFTPDAEFIHSSDDELYHSSPIYRNEVGQFDLYSWDFSYENFWFNNN